MIAESIRDEHRRREAELQALRVKMDETAAAHGGTIPNATAREFAVRLEFLVGEIWRLKGLLRATPCPF